jgi:hypothetical protein
MKTLKLYWLRLKSETPKALKKLMVFFGSISVGCVAAIVMIDQYSVAVDWKEILVKVALVTGGMAASLKFATTNESIVEEEHKIEAKKEESIEEKASQ